MGKGRKLITLLAILVRGRLAIVPRGLAFSAAMFNFASLAF